MLPVHDEIRATVGRAGRRGNGRRSEALSAISRSAPIESTSPDSGKLARRPLEHLCLLWYTMRCGPLELAGQWRIYRQKGRAMSGDVTRPSKLAQVIP